MNAFYSAAVRTAVDTARRNGWTRRGPAEPGFFGRKFVASQEPPVKTRLRGAGERAANTRPEAAMRSCGRTTPHTTTSAA